MDVGVEMEKIMKTTMATHTFLKFGYMICVWLNKKVQNFNPLMA